MVQARRAATCACASSSKSGKIVVSQGSGSRGGRRGERRKRVERTDGDFIRKGNAGEEGMRREAAMAMQKTVAVQTCSAVALKSVASDTCEASTDASAANTAKMNVVFVASEVAPWSKTGGLADVCGALPTSLVSRGHRVMVVAPRYGNYPDAIDTSRKLKIDIFQGEVRSSRECTVSHHARAHIHIERACVCAHDNRRHHHQCTNDDGVSGKQCFLFLLLAHPQSNQREQQTLTRRDSTS